VRVQLPPFALGVASSRSVGLQLNSRVLFRLLESAAATRPPLPPFPPFPPSASTDCCRPIFGVSCLSPHPLGEFRLSTPFPHPATTILVVDDERISRRVAYRILSEEGYRVLEAENRAETLDALSQARGRVHLVIVDVVMPECDGVAIARQILEGWPDQRILYMSAHPAEVLVQHGLTSLDAPFLAKPYTRGEIMAKVKEALERRLSPRPERRPRR
jgi:CheY-like chemotaxis protein